MTQAAASSSAQPSSTVEVTTTSIGRIPTLDGWRGIAIALVLFDHIQSALLGGFLQPWCETGQHGVTIFFVLSGFLITSKLAQGPIQLKRFYIRRIFRLMPVAWMYLAVLLLVGLRFHSNIVSAKGILACVFFFRNYVILDPGASTLHFWSLSLEEQFYLIWPVLLLFLGLRWCRWVAASGAIGCAAYRFLNWSYYDRNYFNSQTHVRADALLVGCLLALLLREPQLRSRAKRWTKWWAFPALVGLAYYIDHFTWLPPLGECVCIAGLIGASVLHPRSWAARPLSFRVLSGLGVVSYSIYVWQELFMILASGVNIKSVILIFFVMPLVVLGSFEYVERPFIRLGYKLASSRVLQSG